MPTHSDRLERNRESKASATRDREPWSDEELEMLELWEGGEADLADLAEILGRTIEACREKFYKSRKAATCTVVKVTKEYRGWMEGDGDGWD